MVIVVEKMKIAALIGGGGRLKSIYECCENDPRLELVAVFSHKNESSGIEWLKEKTDVPGIYLRWSEWKKNGKTREEYDQVLAKHVSEFQADLIVAAGWNLILSPGFLEFFPNKIINLHPAVLPDGRRDTVILSSGLEIPAFRGAHAVRDALDYFKKHPEIKTPGTGATVHYMTEEVDAGPNIIITEVDILPGDTEESLRERILNKEEERILCEAIRGTVPTNKEGQSLLSLSMS